MLYQIFTVCTLAPNRLVKRSGGLSASFTGKCALFITISGPFFLKKLFLRKFPAKFSLEARLIFVTSRWEVLAHKLYKNFRRPNCFLWDVVNLALCRYFHYRQNAFAFVSDDSFQLAPFVFAFVSVNSATLPAGAAVGLRRVRQTPYELYCKFS